MNTKTLLEHWMIFYCLTFRWKLHIYFFSKTWKSCLHKAFLLHYLNIALIALYIIDHKSYWANKSFDLYAVREKQVFASKFSINSYSIYQLWSVNVFKIIIACLIIIEISMCVWADWISDKNRFHQTFDSFHEIPQHFFFCFFVSLLCVIVTLKYQ